MNPEPDKKSPSADAPPRSTGGFRSASADVPLGTASEARPLFERHAPASLCPDGILFSSIPVADIAPEPVCLSLTDALRLRDAGSPLLYVGPLFPENGPRVSARLVTALATSVSVPVIAFGGVTPETLPVFAGTGISGVCIEGSRCPDRKSIASVLSGKPPVTPGAIIDLDGTLLDSHPFWDILPYDYIRSKGKTPSTDLRKTLECMEMSDASVYLKRTYGLPEPPETIADELFACLRDVYVSKAPFFPGAADFVRSLHASGTRLALFTATRLEHARAALERHGVLHLFDTLASSDDMPCDKSSPDSFFRVLELLGTSIQNTVVYDDAPYAIAGASQTGMRVFSTLPTPHQP